MVRRSPIRRRCRVGVPADSIAFATVLSFTASARAIALSLNPRLRMCSAFPAICR